MADKRISDFTELGSLADSDEFLVSNNGTTFKVKTSTIFRPYNPQSGDIFGTSANPIYSGCFGFVTSGAADMELFMPTAYIPSQNRNISISNVSVCTGGLRAVSGGYVISSGVNLIPYLSQAAILAKTGQLRLLFHNGNGFKVYNGVTEIAITNNTPIVGTLTIALTF